VSDTGIGISPEDQKHVFDAFYQVDSSTKKKFGGTGLGLSISKELATLLGGHLYLKSIVGQGSTFTLMLPLKKDLPLADDNNEHICPDILVHRHEPLSAKHIDNITKILIAEHDQNLSSMLKDFSLKRGYYTLVVDNGIDALTIASAEVPHAIILGAAIPGLNGWQVLEKLKKNDSLKEIPVHIISDQECKNDMVFKNVKFLKKPISLNDLQSIFNPLTKEIIPKSTKILIIEDDKNHNHAIQELLSAAAHLPEPAYSGEEALRLLHENKYDGIILDMELPDIHGNDLLLKIRELFPADLPIIIYSGKDFNEDEEKKLKRNTNAVILKTANSYQRLLDEVRLFLKEAIPQRTLPSEKTLPIEALTHKKILVVDDDIRNIYALHNAIEEHSMKIVTANNGNEALQKLKEVPDVDIILMDIMMPVMDGYETIRNIRSQPRYKEIPFIALTAKAMKGDMERCIDAGATDYIAKPLDVNKLLSLIKVCLTEVAHS
jgi:CheY-like chemotaxis protein